MNQKNMEKRLYVLINQNLDPIYGAVQGGHVVAQWLLDNIGHKGTWRNNVLVYLKCDIQKEKRRLDRRRLSYSQWHEPDLDNELTAIAIESDGMMFRKLDLLK